MNLQNSFQNYNDGVEQSKTTYSGLLGLAIDGSQKVNIPTRAGYVYVRLRDSQSEVIQAFNDKVSPVYDFPVLIQRTGNRWTVVGKDEQRYETFGTPAPYLPQHGDQHSFNRDGGGGGDTVWVYPDQFTPLLVYPSGTLGSGNLIVAPYALQRTSDFVYVGNTGTRNLLVYKPTDAQAIVGLVYIDKTSGNPGVLIASGTPMPGTATGTAAVLPYLPFPSSNQEPLYAFRLVSGTTSLTWNNLYNVRQFIGGNTSTSTGSSGGGGISGLVFQDEGITQGTGTVVNFVGDNISVSVSGTVARVFVTGSAGGGSLPSFVTGSIPYAGANGSLKEANPDFRYEEDSETLWLGKRPNTGIGYTEFRFFAVATGTNSGVAFGGIVAGTGTVGSPSPTYNGYRSRGTLDAPTAIKRDDALETINAVGYSGEWKSAARMRFYADGDWVTGTHAASRAEIDVIPSGSYTRRTQFTVRGDSVDIPSGSSYNMGGVPHVHPYIPSTGWDDVPYTVNYSSSDSPSFVINVQGNCTGTYGTGIKWKLGTVGTTQYFIQSAEPIYVSGAYTSITLYGGTDFVLTTGTISSPQISRVKSPSGFPLSKDKWSETLSNTSNYTSTTGTTVYQRLNPSLTITIPIGDWLIDYSINGAAAKAAATQCQPQVALSTSTTSASDGGMVRGIGVSPVTNLAGVNTITGYPISLSSKTDYHIIIKNNAVVVDSVSIYGSTATTTVTAICAHI